MKKISDIINPNPHTDSPIEEILYKEFERYGIIPRVQYEIFPFFVDLAFPDEKLIIEADGAEYHSTPEQKRKDQYRQRKFEARGWKVIRFTGKDIHKNYQFIVAKILLQNFEDRLNEEQRRYAIGRVVDYLMRHGHEDLGPEIVEAYLKQMPELPRPYKD